MAWIPLYADDNDFTVICEWLNREEEIAFLVSHGAKKWIAKRVIEALSAGEHTLWHIPSGPLPLLGATDEEPESTVEDPWKGWTEKRTGANFLIPYFGAGHPGVITLAVNSEGYDASGSIGLSAFGWIGNRYRIIGSGAHQSTEKYWLRLKRWIAKQAIKIPRTGPPDGENPEIWTFPSAYERIVSGVPRDMNP